MWPFLKSAGARTSTTRAWRSLIRRTASSGDRRFSPVTMPDISFRMSSTAATPSAENSTGCRLAKWRSCSIGRRNFGTGGGAGARIIATLLAAALGLAAGAAGADDPVQKNAEQLEKLRGRIASLEQSLERDRSRRDALSTQLEDSERRYADLSATLAELRGQIADQTARRRRTELQRRDAELLMQRHKQSLARQVRASY